MGKQTQIAVIDGSSARRAKIAYELSQRAVRVEVYEGLDEFKQYMPESGIILLARDNSTIDLGDVTSLCNEAGVVLPIALYAENPVPADIVEAMLSGAIDYLKWPIQADELVEALQRIALRSEAFAEQERKEVSARARTKALSPRESEVLELMIDGYSSKDIGTRLGISPRTVEIHRANVLRKLNARSTAEALRVGIYAGLSRN